MTTVTTTTPIMSGYCQSHGPYSWRTRITSMTVATIFVGKVNYGSGYPKFSVSQNVPTFTGCSQKITQKIKKKFLVSFFFLLSIFYLFIRCFLPRILILYISYLDGICMIPSQRTVLSFSTFFSISWILFIMLCYYYNSDGLSEYK